MHVKQAAFVNVHAHFSVLSDSFPPFGETLDGANQWAERQNRLARGALRRRVLKVWCLAEELRKDIWSYLDSGVLRCIKFKVPLVYMQGPFLAKA